MLPTPMFWRKWVLQLQRGRGWDLGVWLSVKGQKPEVRLDGHPGGWGFTQFPLKETPLVTPASGGSRPGVLLCSAWASPEPTTWMPKPQLLRKGRPDTERA